MIKYLHTIPPIHISDFISTLVHESASGQNMVLVLAALSFLTQITSPISNCQNISPTLSYLHPPLFTNKIFKIFSHPLKRIPLITASLSWINLPSWTYRENREPFPHGDGPAEWVCLNRSHYLHGSYRKEWFSLWSYNIALLPWSNLTPAPWCTHLSWLLVSEWFLSVVPWHLLMFAVFSATLLGIEASWFYHWMPYIELTNWWVYWCGFEKGRVRQGCWDRDYIGRYLGGAAGVRRLTKLPKRVSLTCGTIGLCIPLAFSDTANMCWFCIVGGFLAREIEDHMCLRFSAINLMPAAQTITSHSQAGRGKGKKFLAWSCNVKIGFLRLRCFVDRRGGEYPTLLEFADH